MIDDIILLRHRLHQYPDISGQEAKTVAIVGEFLSQFRPDEIIENLGGYGLAAVYRGKEEGPTVLFRCELDALPIRDAISEEYCSQSKGVGHKCGHDGHMAIMASLAPIFDQKRPLKGRAVLLFQPAEETGQGAIQVIEDPRFKAIEPDYCFAFHNLPGFEQGQVVIRAGTFAMASVGMIIRLQGQSSHAAYPEDGVNPALAIASLIQQAAVVKQNFQSYAAATVIYSRIGQASFGTAAGRGELGLTLRTENSQDMGILRQFFVTEVEHLSAAQGLNPKIEWIDAFPATVSTSSGVAILKQLDINYQELEHPMRWSEDFGHFLERYEGAFFGIGAGKNHPQLHHESYDFPDGLISTGISYFRRLAEFLLY